MRVKMWLLAGRKMNMYKLLLLDIDGTLRDEHKGIPLSALQAIKECRELGCQVIICTGRSIGTIQDDVKAIEVDGYICGGGCYIQYQGHIVCDETLPQACVQTMRKDARIRDIPLAMESKHQVYMNQGAKEIFDHMNQTKSSHKNVNKQFIQECIRYEDNMHHYQDEAIHKLCIWSNQDIEDVLQDIFQATYEIAQQDQYLGYIYYEIIKKGCNKGNALQYIQLALHITKQETICFGDGLNDVEMFRQSGCKIAMKHAHKALKEIATAQCDDIFEDGIYKELKKRKVL